MKKIGHAALALSLLLGAALAQADVRVGLHLSIFPDLVPVPGYPVYYAPSVRANYFFYDGYYWLYEDDAWFISEWYDGPWEYVDPDDVPLFVLRVPVRYYRVPPPYFAAWHRDEPPRWGHYWGRRWKHHDDDWHHWDRYRTPRPAPLPVYQREYIGDRYPDRSVQRELRERHHTRDGDHRDRRREVRRDEPIQMRREEPTRVQRENAERRQRDEFRDRDRGGERERMQSRHEEPAVRELRRSNGPDRGEPARERPDRGQGGQGRGPDPDRGGGHGRDKGGDRGGDNRGGDKGGDKGGERGHGRDKG